ncbi:uncharacterized protein ACMZJ9_012038 [Mantella aurantiaca]
MLKTQRKNVRETGIRCAKDEFVCQGWDIATPFDSEKEDLQLCSFTWRCKYLNRDSFAISPALYLRTSETKCKKDPSCLPCPVMFDIPSESKSIKQLADKPKIFSSMSGPSIIKYSTANKETVKDNDKGSRVRRLICITDSISSRHTLDQRTSTKNKIDVSADQCSKGDNVITTQHVSIPCILHYNKDTISEKLGLCHDVDMIENYKDAIAKLRGQTAWKSLSNPENLGKSSFHGHIQTCILQLSNRSSVQPIKLTNCSDNSSFLKSSSGKIKVSEGRPQKIQIGLHHGSFPASSVISVNKNSRLDGERFVWSQNTQEISKVGTSVDKTSLVRMSSLSPGKENAIHTPDIWGFPAFHPYPVKTQLQGSSNSSRGQTRSGKRSQSATKHNSAQSQSRPVSNPNKDLMNMDSQVTLGLMLNAIRTGLKQNQIRVMLGQANRFTEAYAKEDMNKNQHNFSLIHIRQESK